ncbi:MAG: hypothetical protein ABIG39_05680 [Candidatus Micrarchaeota archaeon]
MERLEREITHMASELKKKESVQDSLLRLTRELVRDCSISVKLIHSGDLKRAAVQHKKAKGMLIRIQKLEAGFKHLVAQSYQEYVEISILLAIVKKEDIPTHSDLNVPFGPYMTGLCDCIGELRRQMLEELRHGNRNNAEYYFERMNWMYEITMPLRFSNSLLPGFRKKQDVARVQVENARSELLKSGVGI